MKGIGHFSTDGIGWKTRVKFADLRTIPNRKKRYHGKEFLTNLQTTRQDLKKYEDMVDHCRYTHNLSGYEKNSVLNGIRAHDL